MPGIELIYGCRVQSTTKILRLRMRRNQGFVRSCSQVLTVCVARELGLVYVKLHLYWMMFRFMDILEVGIKESQTT